MASAHESATASSVWSLSKNERKAAWVEWQTEMKPKAAKAVAKKIGDQHKLARELSRLRLQKDLQRIAGARIVGCTMTEAAAHHELLAELPYDVVLVDDAGEVLEAHILTTLRKSTKHLIMIGERETPTLPACAFVSFSFWFCPSVSFFQHLHMYPLFFYVFLSLRLPVSRSHLPYLDGLRLQRHSRRLLLVSVSPSPRCVLNWTVLISNATTRTGDHRQRRPKVEQYDLCVESGKGLDLNVSLSERLIQGGYPHNKLDVQYRMPPEVR